MLKPEGPGVTLASIIVVSHFGQGGREIWNMVLRLGLGGSATLSVTGICREGAVMRPACAPSPWSCWSILLISRKFHEWGVRLRALGGPLASGVLGPSLNLENAPARPPRGGADLSICE